MADNDTEALQTWRHLSHHIRRYPHDLHAHVQRILLAQHEPLSSRVAGSLLDLYLALDNAGHMLRERMLELCNEYLSDDNRQQFSRWLEQGINSQEGVRWLQGSMLATGEVARKKLLTQQRTESDYQYTDLQAEIQDYLAYGQIDLAQELLEREILEGRGSPELEQELLTIYQHTRGRERLLAVAEKLEADGMALSPAWEQARNEAQNW
ncbi:MAG: hypothetical protein R3E95_21605 [Thiolinea sp.]